MKKMIFSAAAFALVAVSSIALAPTTASAIPAFARQTGAACLSCHFQEFPALTPFGRAFKMGSFTDVGDQGLIEDDNLSTTVVLNASMVVRMTVNHTTGLSQPSVTTYDIPTDENFLVAGRVGTNSGAFVEFAGGAGNIQLLNSWDVGGFKVGGGWAKSGFGASAVLEISNVFGQHSGSVGDVGKKIGAVEHSGWVDSFTALGVWIGSDLGYVQFALVAPEAATKNATDVGLKFGKLVRAVATLDVGGWDTLLGFGLITGKLGKAGTNDTGGVLLTDPGSTGVVALGTPEMNLYFIDGQMQGEVGDMSIGLYADFAHAKGKPNGNIMGAGDSGSVLGGTTLLAGTSALFATQKFDAYGFRFTLEPVQSFDVSAGYGYRKITDDAAGADEPKHQVFSIAVSYHLYQNSALSLNFTNDKTSGFAAAASNGNLKTTSFNWSTYM